MKVNKGWPSNSDGQWSRSRVALEGILLSMGQGETRKVVDVCNMLGITRSNFRSIYWQARNNVAKLPRGDDGARVYKFRGDQVRRLTDAEASEQGRADSNKGRRHAKRSLHRLQSVNTSNLDSGQTQRHRLYEAQIQTTLHALSPQKREAAAKKMANGVINAGDLGRLFAGY